MIAAIPVVKAGEKYYVSPHFGRAPFFALADVTGSEPRVIEVAENPYTTHEHGHGHAVTDFLVSRGVGIVVALGVGYGAYERLRARGIKVYYLPSGSGLRVELEEALKMLAEGKLEEAREAREHGH